MKHIVYYEPDFDTTRPNLWQLRGQYKYPSILGDLGRRARVTILMHRVPPPSDPFRIRLERDHEVRFAQFSHHHKSGPWREERLANALSAALDRLQADVISNLNGRSVLYCYASALAAAAAGARYVMRVGGDDLKAKAHVHENKGSAFAGTSMYYGLMRQERVAVDMAGDIIVMTRREQARVAAMARDAGKIVVCYRGVDQQLFRAQESRTGPCRKVLFVGRKSAEKGYDLAEAAARLLYAGGEDIEFTFAGTFEPQSVENRRYVGYVGYPDLPALYEAHDAVVMCSRTEGFPQVLMEAMSMGLPCITSRHLFERDFANGSTALFCATDSRDIAEKVLQLHHDQALYAHLSRESLSHARTEFDQDALQRRYQRVLLGD